MPGFPQAASETPLEFDQQIVSTATNPLFAIPTQPSASVPDQELKRAVQSCLDAKGHSSAHK
jgi:hypothetical protein